MSRFPIPKPRSDEGTMLPAALLGVLAAMIALQLWLTGTDTPLPVDDGGPMLAPYVPPRMTTSAVAPAILEQPIFSPARTRGGAGEGGGGGDLLDGAQVAGAWSIGRRSRVVLRKPDGSAMTLGLGESVNGWRLAGITTEGARFARGGDSELIPFGASAPRSRQPAGDDQPEEEQQ